MRRRLILPLSLIVIDTMLAAIDGSLGQRSPSL
jgi:hypothetical protein